jgi:hypothetical protein
MYPCGMRTAQRITKLLLQTVPCEKAEELLDHLSPHIGEHLWDRPDQDDWIFRGQAEAVWSLKPAALRKDAFKGFIAGQVEEPQRSIKERRALEASLVTQFASRASLYGFEIPGDAQRLRDRDHYPLLEAHDFPPLEHRGIYALAQHYGVPTRLLDWTIQPLFAAYFAARDAVSPERKLTEGSDGRMAVWAVQFPAVDDFLREKNPGAVVLTVPTVSNPNLHAQSGVFTLVRFRQPPRDDEDIPDLDALMRDEANVESFRRLEGKPLLPMMFKFTLPHAEGPGLLHYLDLAGVNAAVLYPGLHSVVPYMREASLRSVRLPPGSDS